MALHKTRRQIELLALVQQRAEGWEAEDLCDELSIEIATLNRDLRDLRKMGVAIYSRKRKIQLNQPLQSEQYHELLSLYLSASGHVIGFPKNIKNVSKKLKEKTLVTFRFLLHSIEKRYVIRIKYKKLYNGEVVWRTVEPYDIVPGFYDWRLIAYSDGIYKQFIIDNIQEVEITSDKFRRDKYYNLDVLFRNSISYWTAAEEHTVVLRFKKSVAHLVENTLWSDNQKIENLPRGEIKLTLKVNSIPQIGNWVMGWGGAVEVIEPTRLRRYVERQAKEILKIYSYNS